MTNFPPLKEFASSQFNKVQAHVGNSILSLVAITSLGLAKAVVPTLRFYQPLATSILFLNCLTLILI